MSYPILKTNKAKSIGDQINRALELNPADQAPLERNYQGLEKEVETRKGADLNEEAFHSNLQTFLRNMREDRKNGVLSKLRMEEDFAEHFVEQLPNIGNTALQDPDFWRYLALFPYRSYVYQREGDFSAQRYGGAGDKNFVRWTLVRGMLWGLRTLDETKTGEERFWATRAYKNAREDAGYKRPEDTVPDFYISQIIRRKWSFHKDAYLAYIGSVIEPPVAIDQQGRENTQFLGSRLGRISENVYLPALDVQNIKDLVAAEKANLPKPDPNLVE